MTTSSKVRSRLNTNTHRSLTVAAPGNADLQIGSGRPRERQLQYTFARSEVCLRLPTVEV
jgi:hypothetical protein